MSKAMIVANVDTHEVAINAGGNTVVVDHLTYTEFSLLRELGLHSPRILDRDFLLSTIWGHEAGLNLDTRTVDQHVARMRNKLRKACPRTAECFITVTNRGYKARGVSVINLAKEPDMVGPVVSIKRRFGAKSGSQVTVNISGLAPVVGKGTKLRLMIV